MKYLIIFIATFSFGFDMFFKNTYQINLFPNRKAILLETNKTIPINYSPKFYTKKGIVLLDYDNADEFVRNDLYFNGKIKNVKVAIFDEDKTREKIVQTLKKYYKNCKLKKIEFIDKTQQKVFFQPTNLIVQTKVSLDCK